MAIKVYSDNDSVIIEDNYYTQRSLSEIRYYVYGDNIFLYNKENTNEYWRFGVNELQDSNGSSIGNLAAVKSYLNGFLGQGTLNYILKTYAFSSDGTSLLAKPGNQQEGRQVLPPAYGSFDAANSQTITTDLVIDKSDNFTICFWIKGIVDVLANTTIITNRNGSTGFQMRFDATERIRMVINGGVSIFTGTGISDGTWKFVALNFTEGTIQVYVNESITSGAHAMTASTGTFKIASYANAEYGTFDMRGVRYYENGLSHDNIIKLARQQSISIKATNEILLNQNGGTTHPIDSGSNHCVPTLSDSTDFWKNDGDFTVLSEYNNIYGYTLSDGATYYFDDGGSDLIPSGVLIPAKNSYYCAAYLANGDQAELQFKGKLPLNFIIGNVNTWQGNGSDRFISLGDLKTYVRYISSWVKLNSDNQVLFSIQNSTATAISVTAGVLTFGGSLTGSNITVDGNSKTASEAGVLLNDNGWHLLTFELSEVSGSNFQIATDGTNYGNVAYSGIRINEEILIQLEEGTDSVVTDLVTDDKHSVSGTTTSQWILEEGVPSRNLTVGYDYIGSTMYSAYLESTVHRLYESKPSTPLTFDYYVSTTGSDLNDGTSSNSPLKSFGQLLTVLGNAGADSYDVHIASGTYNEVGFILDGSGYDVRLFFDSGVVIDNESNETYEIAFEAENSAILQMIGNSTYVQNVTNNGMSNRNSGVLKCWDIHAINCYDGFTAHAAGIMWLFDCSAVQCGKTAFAHVNSGTKAYHFNCYFAGSNADAVGCIQIDADTYVLNYNCTIVPPSTGQTTRLITSVVNTTVPNSLFINCRIGTLGDIDSSNQSLNATINSCTFIGCYMNLKIAGATDSKIKGCFGTPTLIPLAADVCEITGCTFVGGYLVDRFINFAADTGIDSVFTIKNNIISGFTTAVFANSASRYGAINSDWTLDYNCFYDNVEDYDTGVTAGANDITSDPLIGDADSYNIDDYRISSSSPCRGAGENSAYIGVRNIITNPSNRGHNGSEVTFQPYEVYELYIRDIDNFLFDVSDVSQEISYTDFVNGGGDIDAQGLITYSLNESNRSVTNLTIKS